MIEKKRRALMSFCKGEDDMGDGAGFEGAPRGEIVDEHLDAENLLMGRFAVGIRAGTQG